MMNLYQTNNKKDQKTLDDLYATGLMRPLAKEMFKSHVIIDSERPLTDLAHYNDEMR